MILYSLKCAADHGFDSWFPGAAGFDDQRARNLIQCPVCGSTSVEKALMAPAVSLQKAAPSKPANLTTPQDEREKMLAELRQKIEANSDYVGMNFVSEARRIHNGDAPERAIHGEAKPEEAIKLIEDGVPVAPLPFMPTRKMN